MFETVIAHRRRLLAVPPVPLTRVLGRMHEKATVKPGCRGYRSRRASTRSSTTAAGSTVADLQSQITDSGPFADKLDTEQHAEQPDCRDREAGPKIERQKYSDDAARQDPTPVRKGSNSQGKDDFGNALYHQEHNQKKRDGKQSLAGIA